MTHVRTFAVVLLAIVAAGASFPALGQSVAKPKVAGPSAEAKATETAKAYAAGLKAFDGGKTGTAIAAFSTAIAAGGLKNPELAKALFFRGVAQRTEKKPGAALSDLNAAVWLRDGLSATDKAVAEDHRQALLREVTPVAGTSAPVASVAPAADADTLPWVAAPVAAQQVEPPVAAVAAVDPVHAPVAETETLLAPPPTDVTPAPVLAASPAPAAPTFLSNAPAALANAGTAAGAFIGQLFNGGAAAPAVQEHQSSAPPVETGALDTAATAPPAAWTVTTEAAVPPVAAE